LGTAPTQQEHHFRKFGGSLQVENRKGGRGRRKKRDLPGFVLLFFELEFLSFQLEFLPFQFEFLSFQLQLFLL